jgi:hypothetical protein
LALSPAAHAFANRYGVFRYACTQIILVSKCVGFVWLHLCTFFSLIWYGPFFCDKLREEYKLCGIFCDTVDKTLLEPMLEGFIAIT